ncbi:MAG: hypothetical protein ACI39F_02980 [Acutalibacteraceae bacterium]
MKKLISILFVFLFCCSIVPGVSADGIKKIIKPSFFAVNTKAKTYTGKVIKPKITSKLKRNKDYKIIYKHNKNVGTATVTIKGIGNYAGTIKKKYKITKKKIKLNDFKFTLNENHTKVNIKSKLKRNKDYKISYNNNISASTSTITIKGIGNYKGKITKTFKVVFIKLSEYDFDIDTIEQTYTGKPIVLKIRTKLTANKDYTVIYTNNVNVGTATVTIKGTGVYYGEFSKNFKIEQKELSMKDFEIDLDDKVYTGSAICPQVKSELVINKDYKLEYKNNVNAGKGEILITGIENCTGTVEKRFAIVPKPITIKDFKFSKTLTFTGKPIEPITSELEINKDYKLEYENNIEIGTATVTITGIGNYDGELIINFEIVAPKVEKINNLNLEIPKTRTIQISWNTVTNATGYEFYMTTNLNKNFKKIDKFYLKNYAVKNKKGIANLESCEEGKTYYIKIRAYKTVANINFYGEFSDVVSIKVPVNQK